MYKSKFFNIGKVVVTHEINEAMKKIADLQQKSMYPYSGIR